MPVFDDTTFRLIQQGERAAALGRLDNLHPGDFLEVIGAASEHVLSGSRGSTGDSLTVVASGALAFTANRFFGAKQGDTIILREDADPANIWMYGYLTADQQLDGGISMQVTKSSGSGIFTLWAILVGAVLISETASNPVSAADGGWATDMTIEANQEVARRAYFLGTTYRVISVRSSPPALPPALNDRYIVGPNPTGDFAGLESDLVTWNGASWVASNPGLGSIAIVENGIPQFGKQGGIFLYQGIEAGTLADGAWENSRWRHQGSTGGVPNRKVIQHVEINNPYQVGARGSVIVVDAAPGNRTVTLPAVTSGAMIGQEFIIVRIDSSINTLTVNVSGGGNINGVPSIAIPSGFGRHAITAIGIGPGLFDYAY